MLIDLKVLNYNLEDHPKKVYDCVRFNHRAKGTSKREKKNLLFALINEVTEACHKLSRD